MIDGSTAEAKGRFLRPSAPLLMVGAFILANLAIFALADSSCYRLGGACSNQHDIYASPTARALLQFGSIVDPTRPDEPWTYRQWPPVSGAIMAATLLRDGATNLYPLAVLQIAFLLITGWLVRSVLRDYGEGIANVGFGLVIFNPNALAGAHLPANETVFALALTASFYLLYRYSKGAALSRAAASGAALGLAILVRPTPQYLVPLLPLIVMTVAVSARRASWLSGLWAGSVALATCAVVLGPWIAFQVQAGVGARLAGPGTERLLLAFNLAYLTDAMPGEGNHTWRASFEANENMVLQAEHSDWDELSAVQRDHLRLQHTKAYLMSAPFEPRTALIAFAKSTVRFFVSGGEGELHSLFGMENSAATRPVAFYGIKSVAIGWSFALRVFGLFGALLLVRRGDWPILVLCMGMILYFWLTSLVLGKPRFRIVVEPQLMILAAFGMHALRERFHRPAALTTSLPARTELRP